MNNYESRISELEYENSQLKRDLQTVLHLNEELRHQLKERDKKIEKLEKKVSNLEKELEKYKVKPNEPSGAKPDFTKDSSQKPKSKPGQKKGHNGTSRLRPSTIHKIQHYNVKSCKHCGSFNFKEKNKTRSKIITDLEFNVINTKEIYHDVTCCNCGQETRPQSIHGKSKSPFGRVFQTFIGYIRSICGNTIRPIENLFRDFFKLEVSDTSILNNEIRISNESIEEYNNYLDLVQKSTFSHKDETSYRINGKTNWIWVYDSGNYVFYRLADTRSKTVIKNDFGNTKQISINDCYNAYDDLDFQQICWAHLLREAEAHAEKDSASLEEKKFNEQLACIYKQAKSFVAKDPPLEKRQEERAKLENQLCDLMLSLKNKSEFLERICNRLNNRLMHCFLFVEKKGLPSTNNQAERALRPFVIHRKASFGSKSEDGGQAKVRLKTLYENARRRGEQLSYTLEHLFEKQEFVVVTNT